MIRKTPVLFLLFIVLRYKGKGVIKGCIVSVMLSVVEKQAPWGFNSAAQPRGDGPKEWLQFSPGPLLPSEMTHNFRERAVILPKPCFSWIDK